MNKKEQMSDERPWGKWEIIALGDNYKVKRITVKPGERLSLQKHKIRKENWTIVSDGCYMTLNDKTFKVDVGETVIINPGDIHRVENKGKKELIFIEVQTGEYLGEDDIERIEDDYNRT
jgi:mannose-6-phosphate isomerase-like protein (cupin superfamily)